MSFDKNFGGSAKFVGSSRFFLVARTLVVALRAGVPDLVAVSVAVVGPRSAWTVRVGVAVLAGVGSLAVALR